MLINGRYQVLHPLQEGGFGHTFLAEDTQLPSRRRCVIKQLKPVHHNPEFYRLIQDRFQREAAIQETLGEACPQIPRLYAYFLEGDLFYLVEEWIDGETLRQKIDAVGPFSEAAVRDMLVDVLSTIEVVHQHQIVHRDIKPDNIILRRRDGRPVLIDFGAVKESMATMVNSQGETGRSIVIGTTGYMAPEQSAGRPMFSSDLYSLGLTAIYLLTGKSPVELHADPHTGQMDWRSHAPQASDSFVRNLNVATHINPSERFGNAHAMREALQKTDPAYAPTLVSTPQPATPPIDPTMPRPVVIPQPIAQPQPQPVAAATTPQSVSPTLATQVVAPAVSSFSGGQRVEPPAASSNQWMKSALIGGGIGGALLVGFALAKGLSPAPVVSPAPSPIASSVPVDSTSPSVSTTPTPITSPSASTPPSAEPSVSPSTEPVVTAPATCGDRGDRGLSWYPVFINHADLGQVQRDYCQDAIAKTRDDGTPAVQVASFTERSKAEAFAKKVGGDVGQPYQTGPSPSSSVSPSPSPTVLPPKNNDRTNAVIIGNKGQTNIRKGPGTNYPAQHYAYPGDRVKILASAQDRGGYIWYEVYFPKSGASGWIAGQLLQPD
jgi:serine/threonine protein kinase, bacterial